MRTWISIAALLLSAVVSAQAQELSRQQQIDEAKDLLTTACLSGTSFEFDANADGRLEIKSLKPGAGGKISVNVKKDPGGVGYLNEEIRKGVDAEIRDCMKPYISRILDIISGVKSSSLPKEPNKFLSATASAIEGKSVRIVSAEMNESAIKKKFKDNELDEYSNYFAEQGRPWDHDVIGVPSGDEALTKQLIFDAGDLVGLRYARSEDTPGPKQDCGLPLLDSWYSIKARFDLGTGDIRGNRVNGRNSGLNWDLVQTQEKISFDGGSAFYSSSETYFRDKPGGWSCSESVIALMK
ncbi:hypothetical protein HFN62_30285 [Rhizobium leguminosarum]|uniref:Uncharacterized protein n=1 Tax=Rhizobium leguminosarum TaxID=384 RepID=A0A1L3ZNR4_RHILE|nr:hypothetical protein [Rhizobium leguminosarum]API57200.1 hypothetical protein BMW22_37940 [Rhizobium leguminosarum]MBY5788005.1 hypothetical protein [Rhizobium leguminosarum]NKK65083.1 hypothetical protein [Rhizobium leguminosarum bv. viciae]NKL06457.1 hypothetical protein [Rhizobium leguminosarum bv. viciae]NKL84959.1 hypothetical protein [Rhizobium leguminosarum bv. viciae]